MGMMTTGDYIRALRVCRAQNVSMQDLATRSIADMLASPLIAFQHAELHAIDAEDTIQQMCRQLLRLNADFVSVVDPDEGSLISILGYLDIVHLLDLAAKQHPSLFSESIEQMRIGTFSNVITAPHTAPLADVLAALEDRNLSGMPVTDEAGRVVGMYHRSDVTFITQAGIAAPDAILTNLARMTVGDVLLIQQQAAAAGEAHATMQSLVTCRPIDKLESLLSAMMARRSTVAVVVNDAGGCMGVISIHDIVQYYI